MILVNLFGAPGAGKSTGAAYIFSQLKMRGINAELVTEFAKDKVWEGSKAVFENQAYIFDAVVRRVAKKYNSKNYYLKRVKDYNPAGRFQTEEESDEIATELKRLLDREGVEHEGRRGVENGYEQIVEDVMREFVTYENTTEE